MADTDGWAIDADLAIPPLQALGWRVDTVEWRRPGVDWSSYDAVYIGTPWDYPQAPDEFLAVLQQVHASGALLVNELELVKWNIDKTYLADLERRGVPIVPTRWFGGAEELDIAELRKALRAGRIIVKPVVSTNATDTFLLGDGADSATGLRIAERFAGRALMVQPFIESVTSEGEYSLFFIGGELSHSICKTPGQGDFRVQEEHGASIRPVEPEPELVEAGRLAHDAVSPAPTYARCDFVRAADGRFLLMELELIEPSLYLRMHPLAATRFAAAFDARVRAARA